MKNKIIASILLFLLITASTGCTKDPTTSSNLQDNPPLEDQQQTLEEEPQEINYNQIKPNEAGQVMIVMYHNISPEEKDWTRSIENFKNDLQTFYDNGYRLISLKDFVNNNIDIPAGTTPLILTFDDSPANQFNYIAIDNEVEIDPDSAVGIMKKFSEEHPDFGLEGTFYLSYEVPFRQKEYWKEKLKVLVEDLGMDVGNHTLTHPFLNKLSDDQVQKELAAITRKVSEALPNYQIDSFALPYGISPKNYELAIKGAYEGIQYEHKAILLVGANPAPAPNNKGFNPYRLPRVQGSTAELTKWIEYFKNNPDKKYISDGDPDTISVPKAYADEVDREKLGNRTLKIYELEQ